MTPLQARRAMKRRRMTSTWMIILEIIKTSKTRVGAPLIGRDKITRTQIILINTEIITTLTRGIARAATAVATASSTATLTNSKRSNIMSQMSTKEVLIRLIAVRIKMNTMSKILLFSLSPSTGLIFGTKGPLSTRCRKNRELIPSMMFSLLSATRCSTITTSKPYKSLM